MTFLTEYVIVSGINTMSQIDLERLPEMPKASMTERSNASSFILSRVGKYLPTATLSFILAMTVNTAIARADDSSVSSSGLDTRPACLPFIGKDAHGNDINLGTPEQLGIKCDPSDPYSEKDPGITAPPDLPTARVA